MDGSEVRGAKTKEKRYGFGSENQLGQIRLQCQGLFSLDIVAEVRDLPTFGPNRPPTSISLQRNRGTECAVTRSTMA